MIFRDTKIKNFEWKVEFLKSRGFIKELKLVPEDFIENLYYYICSNSTYTNILGSLKMAIINIIWCGNYIKDILQSFAH